MDIKIDKSVALPPPINRGKGITPALRAMNVGDSIFLPGYTPAKVGGIVRNVAPRKFTSRTREEDGKMGIRMWRTE